MTEKKSNRNSKISVSKRAVNPKKSSTSSRKKYGINSTDEYREKKKSDFGKLNERKNKFASTDERPKRNFKRNDDERPKRTYKRNDDERPKRNFKYNDDERPKRNFKRNDDERPKRTYKRNDDERPARNFKRSDDERPKRTYKRNDDERPKRNFKYNDDERPKRNFKRNDDERPKRNFKYNDDERPKRNFKRNDDERPKRTYKRNDDERPARNFKRSDDERPKRNFKRNDDERPARNFKRNDDERPKRNFRHNDDERPKRVFEHDDEFSHTRKFSDDTERTSRYSVRVSEPVDSRIRRKQKEAKAAVKTPVVEIETNTIRLNKFIANSGVCSRREADEFIQAGVVSVNGTVVTELGMKISPDDEIRFNGELLHGVKKIYLLMNKPKGFVTTTDDPHAEKTVMDIVHNYCKERIYPVGRLDKNTTGVLLFTNDGELAKTLTHPSYGK